MAEVMAQFSCHETMDAFNFHLTVRFRITNRTQVFTGAIRQKAFDRSRGRFVAKPELGNKHQCQNCGAKFFDLNKNPIVCPKCGTIFHAAPLSRAAQRAAAAEEEDVEAAAGAELVSLDDAEAAEEKIVAAVDDEVEIEVADDTFLEEEEEDGDDVVDLIEGDREEDEER